MSDQWFTVDATGHVPYVAAELPPGRVLIDTNTGQIMGWDYTVPEEAQPEQTAQPVMSMPEQEQVTNPPVEEQGG